MGRKHLFISFASALRHGEFHNGRRITSSTISETLHKVSVILVAHGARDPRKTSPGQFQLDKDFQDLYKAYKDEDAAPRTQHAVPNTTVRWLSEHFRTSAVRDRTAAALIVLAFFFLLRVGEYTPSRNKQRKKRTIPLRKCDVVLLRDGAPLDREAPLELLRTATGCTICLENQKNGVKDQTLYHDASGDDTLCPVTAMAFLIHQLRGNPDDTPLGTCYENGREHRTSASEVLAMIRLAAMHDNLQSAGYDLSRIGTHSLRAGGAVRLKLAGEDDGIIKKLGRWSSETYAKYIQPHIGPITGGCAARMANSLRYYNVHVR